MAAATAILSSLRSEVDIHDYRKKHWEGTFEEYLDIVREHPEVTRTAYQRLYDMILSHGTEDVYENKEKVTRYKFFTEFAAQHGDAIYGLDRPLMQLVNTFKSAAKGYGTERRVLLLHGPVGIVQEHHRPPAQDGPGGVLAHRRGHALLLLLEEAGRHLAQSARCTRSRCT